MFPQSLVATFAAILAVPALVFAQVAQKRKPGTPRCMDSRCITGFRALDGHSYFSTAHCQT